MASFFKASLKEPFVHFVLLGAALFMGHAVWAKTQTDTNTIIVETAEMERQALIFAGENRREPTDDDLKALLYAYIEEDVLVREAMKRGLDTGDTIIRRRLAQKMRFLIEDVTEVEAPSDAVLRAWFETRQSDFGTPALLSFTHIYLSPEKHPSKDEGEDIFTKAQALFAQVQSNDALDMTTFGDPFMLKKRYRNVSETDIKNLFGENFAKALFAPKDNPKNSQETLSQTGPYWHGVISSPFGVHIVRIDNQTPAQAAEFETVRDTVQQVWIDTKTRETNQMALKNLIEKYTVEVEGPN